MLNDQERQQVVGLAAHLTGSSPVDSLRRELLAKAVESCMRRCQVFSLAEYLARTHTDEDEFSKFVSALTVHTTSWFREGPHFLHLEEYLKAHFSERRPRCLKVWSAACSSGEEVFTIALVLEKFRKQHPHFEYQVTGTDLDPTSVGMAARAVYDCTALPDIPEAYRGGLMLGGGKTEGLFTLSPAIRQRCLFKVADVLSRNNQAEAPFDIVFCRNVLIYFNSEAVRKAVTNCCRMLRVGGMLVLGHSETITTDQLPLAARGNATYVRVAKPNPAPGDVTKNVLVVDDSPTIRQLFIKFFEGTEFHAIPAANAKEATAVLRKQQVELVTLDLDMPGQQGLDWLIEQRAAGLRTPVVIISDAHPSKAAGYIGALEEGAQDFVEKGTLLPERIEIMEKFRGIVGTRGLRTTMSPIAGKDGDTELTRPDLILIGASTGGPQALSTLLAHFPLPAPPILVVQHLPPSFAQAFPKHLALRSGLRAVEPRPGLILEPNCLYMSWGDYHIGLKEKGGAAALCLSDSGPRNGHRPSVDFLFESAAGVKKRHLAILLTGMGRDGAQGMLKLRLGGAMTFAEDHTSCVIFGMPREAIKLHAAQFVGSLGQIREKIEHCIRALPGDSGRPAAGG